MQYEVVRLLCTVGRASAADLCYFTGASHQTLKALERAELVAFSEEEELRVPLEASEQMGVPITLNAEQQAAFDGILALSKTGKPEAALLQGVTGSGKTLVYIRLVQEILKQGRTAMVLVPEIVLTPQMMARFSSYFGRRVAMLHSSLKVSERYDQWKRIRRGEVDVVLGTRSAIFAPLRRLGLIVLDEEQEGSYQSENPPRYHTRDVAKFRCGQEGAVLVLGSATPDVKTFYAARRGVLSLTRLPHRVGGGALPSIELVDISRDAVGAGQGLLAQASLEALRETVRRGEQAVVLLNRRGYAPLMYCLDCKTVARCPHCDIGLTYHKRREQLVCHYCGFTLPFPSPCARCGGLNYLPMGEGTERLEERLAGEELAAVLPPGGRVLRLDRDSTRRPGRMEEILAAFARGEAQVLVGTQMLSKGHHFPDVTLALIADADLGLNLPDYRAMERTFQLLLQSAGRAGRGEKAGRVLIQTRMPNHVCWDFVRRGDYDAFYEHEIALREKRRYPPFVKLALVRASFPAEDAEGGSEGQAALNRFMGLLREEGRTLGLTLMGPIPSPLARLQGRMRFQALIKADDWQKVRQAYGRAMRRAFGGGAAPKTLRLSLDLDPVNML